MILEYIKLARYNRPNGAWLLFFPCIWSLALTNVDIKLFLFYALLFLLGAFCMRAAGCIWNDYIDKDIDIKVKRTRSRPLASKKISNTNAFIFMSLNLLLSLLVLSALPTISIYISLLSIPLIIIYPFMKRITWWPQVWLGIVFNWGVFVGWSSGSESLPNLVIYIIYLAAVIWTTGYDTAYGFQDIQDDIKLNIKSTAIFFKNRGNKFICATLIASSFLMNYAFYLNHSNFIVNIFISIIFLYLIFKSLRANLTIPDECLNLFNKNSISGMLISLVFILDMVLTR